MNDLAETELASALFSGVRRSGRLGLSDQVPPKGGRMPFITGGDWSVGINTPTSLSQAEVLTVLGQGLQKLYGGLIEEGVPEHLAAVVEKLEQADE